MWQRYEISSEKVAELSSSIPLLAFVAQKYSGERSIPPVHFIRNIAFQQK
jgi:hypothetical protein